MLPSDLDMYDFEPVAESPVREVASAPPDEMRRRPVLGRAWVSSAGRLGNVIVDPVVAFREIDTAPTWALAFAALIALRFGSLFAFYRPAVTPLKLVAGIGFQVMSVAPPVLVLTFVLWTVARVWRTELSWPSALSVTVHVMFAYTVLTVLIASVAGALLPESFRVELRNPPFTNLAPLAGGGSSEVVSRLLGAVDVRIAYAFALVYLGVAAVLPQGEKRRAIRVVVTCVALHLAVAASAGLVRGR